MNLNENYNRDYDLVAGIHYGNNGIIPCIQNSNGACVSSSGDSICGCYLGSVGLDINGNKLYIIKCEQIKDCQTS